MMKHYDVIISGAGIAGASLAARLGSHHIGKSKRILLLDTKKTSFNISDNPKQWDLRTVTISPGNKYMLQRIPGVYKQLLDHGKLGIVKKMHVYDAQSSSSNGITFDNPDALVVENAALNKALVDNMPSNVDTNYSEKIEKFHNFHFTKKTQTTPLAQLDEKYTAELLVGADGANSQVRRDTGIEQKWKKDYLTRATCAQLKTKESTDCTAWQRFLPTGPIALLPLDDEHFNLVWSCTTEMANRLKELNDDNFVKEVNHALQAATPYEPELLKKLPHLPSSTRSLEPLRPPHIESIIGPRASFPIHAVAGDVTSSRVALIGDAAHRVHPLAGQGLNMGLRDVQNLESCILSAWSRGADIGVDDDVLPHYAKLQLVDNAPVTFTTNAMDALMKSTFQPIVAARNVGMSVVDNLPPVKELLEKYAKS